MDVVQEQIIRLSELKKGQKALIKHHEETDFRLTLMEMGCVPGQPVQVEMVARYRKGNGKSSLTYIFCNDEYLLDINRKFLDHDTYTDIITFDLTSEGELLAGEIYISTDRVADNAEKFGTGYKDELHRVIFHGALHLCGFKDKSATDKKKMREMEDKCLEEYFK